MLMLKKPMDPNLEPLCSNGRDPAKVPKYKYAMMVLFRSENLY
jgi:hypothetical protein